MTGGKASKVILAFVVSIVLLLHNISVTTGIIIKDSKAPALNEPSRKQRQPNVINDTSKHADSNHTTSASPSSTPLSTSGRPSDSLSIDSKYLKRGPHFIYINSGCFISRWVYLEGPRKYAEDCAGANPAQSLTSQNVQQLKANDTIYCPIKLIRVFCVDVLPLIRTDFVLISGQVHFVPEHNRVRPKYLWRILNNPRLQLWLLQNPNLYSHFEGLHPKMGAWPLGLKNNKYNPRDRNEPHPKIEFEQAFQRHMLVNKTRGVLYGYLNPNTSKERRLIPSGPKLTQADFYSQVAKSQFLISPSGHKPDCYRNYEALAFGTIPITDLDKLWFGRLFQDTAILYNTTKWNMTVGEAWLRLQSSAEKVANRNLIFEEYWMQYAEDMAGRKLQWWDRKTMQPSLLCNMDQYDC
jgi:hypothetical protein